MGIVVTRISEKEFGSIRGISLSAYKCRHILIVSRNNLARNLCFMSLLLFFHQVCHSSMLVVELVTSPVWLVLFYKLRVSIMALNFMKILCSLLRKGSRNSSGSLLQWLSTFVHPSLLLEIVFGWTHQDVAMTGFIVELPVQQVKFLSF